MTLAVIGGSALYALPGLAGLREITVATPYGEPSAPLAVGRLQDREVVFLARHGAAHRIPPHAINYRANLWALHAQGVSQVVAVATVGGITAGLAPGVIALPDQIIDYTWGRAATFHDGTENREGGVGSSVRHIDFTRPYDEDLRGALRHAARRAGVPLYGDGQGQGEGGVTYGVTQGPRLETAAEIERMRRDGAHLVGMTGMPEAALARELGLAYATLAVVVNAAAGTPGSVNRVDLTTADTVGRAAMAGVVAIINAWVGEQVTYGD